MATSPTKTVKISQTIMLDIDFSKVDSVRIVDVDLLILLKDGQRLIVPEGAVRAMMDNEFSINFKGRLFSVASLMELQTFQALRVTEVGIASKPALPETSTAPVARDVQRLDLSGDLANESRQQAPIPPEPIPEVKSALVTADQPPSPPKASTEADAQARETASTLDRQPGVTPLQLATGTPTPGAVERPGADTALSTSALKPTDSAALVTPTGSLASAATPGLSSMWKYAVGVLGAGLAAVAARVGSKAAETVVDAVNPTQAAAGDITLTGVLALGPYQEGTQLKVVVRGVDAQGNSIDLTNTTMAVGANSRYSLKLDSAYNRYTGPIMLVIRDGDSQNEGDYRDEATGQLVNMGSLMLRAVSNLNTAGETSINLTPLTELAVRVALAGSTDPQRVPSQISINNANTTVAKAFGLGAQQDVTTAAVKTVFDNSFDAADAGVGTKYALVLAALSGVDSLQQEGNAAANAEATLSEFAAHFTSTPSTSSVLSQTLIGRLLEGALVTQPIVQGTTGSTTLNVAALLARQIADPANSAGQTKTLALVTSSVTALGAQGTTVEFLFDKPVTALQASDVSFSDQRYSLTAMTRLDATGTHWSATLVPPPKATGSVTISFNNTNWNGNTWTWGVDLIAPSSPESILLVPATATTPGSDSGVSNTDQISQVKTPTVRIKLGADTVAGDVVTVRQIDTSTDHPILGADGKPRNVVNKVITAKDVGAGTVDITLGDLGVDGEYRLVVSQLDAAGNASTLESRNYLAYTLDTVAPQVPDLFNVTNGAINFGPQTPLGLVNAATKQAGFVLKGSGEVGSMVSLAWGNTLLTTLVNQQGEWSLSIDDSKVPADNTNSQLTLTQADVAGNVSKAKTYKVEIATAGVTAQVVSIVVSDDNAETAAGAYSGNASGVMTAGMSTDDNTPVVTIKLDRPLYNKEVIEVYDGTRNAQSTPLFTLSGDYASIQDKLYAWTFNTSNWPTTKALSAGTHRLTARVVNTYTLDVGADTDTERAGPTFVVQTLDFNQLLVPTGDGELTNLIQPGKSAGAESIASTPSNTPKLGGTLTAALGTGERLGIYDGEQYLGDATLTPVTDRTSPHAYTWEYQITQALKNGAHDLSVRLETSTSTPLVRMAMSQDMTISLPVLTMEGTVDLNGTLVVNDTGWSSSDGYSNNRTPTLTLTLPAGYQAGDRITLMGTSSAMSPNAPPIEVASNVLTPLDLDQGFARITTNALGNTGQANRVWRLWATFENTQGGVQVSNTAPVIYELDTTQPDLPQASQMSLKNDTSKGFFTTQTGQLNAINFDVTRERLQYKIDKDGKTLQDWTDTPPGIELDVGASGRNWGDGKYTISARLVDKAGNFKPISAGSALGAGNGYINFVLDTTKPLALAAPTLQADTTNNLPANASDKVTSNFLLADPTPKTETGATLQYSVAAPGSDVSTVTWYGTYLDAMGAANGLSGAALSSWVELAGSAGTLAQAAALLKEGVYVVTRRQIDKAGNESPQASLSFKLNTKALPITAALSNDTSFGQKVSSDVTVGVSGLEGTAGTDVVITYTLTRYTDATRTPSKQIGSPIITNVTPSNAYKPPTADGFYTLVVRSVNKAGLVSTSTLKFELDTTNPLAPGAITLDASSNSARQAFDSDTAGTADATSTSTAPTFNVVLPSGARVGDRLALFLNGDVTKAWGEALLTVDHLLSGTAPVPLNPLPTENDDGVTPLDGAYTFKARLFDVAGNASVWGPAFTYTQDTQVREPTIAELALPGLPPNFINHRDDVTFSGTGEPGAYLTLNWTSKDGNNTDVVKTFHTEVNPQGMWTLTVSKADFPPDTARLGYDSSVTVSQIDPSGNVSGVSAPLMLALNAQAQTITASITAITDLNQSNVASGTPLADDYYAVNPTGVIIGKGQTTDEHRPWLTGTLSAALPALMTGDGVPSNQVVVKVYDGETYLGNATIDAVNAQAWSYQVPTALADGLHRFRVDVFDPLTLQSSAKSEEYAINSNVLTLTANDPNHQNNWVITTTSRPTLQGTLKAVLANDEIVAVYDQQPEGHFKLLGTVSANSIQRDPDASVYRWSFDMPIDMFGQHHYRVQIEKRTSGSSGFTTTPLLAIDQAVRFDLNSITLAPSADTGRSPSDNISNVKSPTVLVHLSSNIQVNDRVDLTVEDVNQLNLYQVSHTILADEKNSGVVSLVIPDLHQLSLQLGLPAQDGNFTINALVAGAPVLNSMVYLLDTVSPTYTPEVGLQQRTGQNLDLNTDTGYTSNKTLTSLTQKPPADQSVYEQVQAVSDSGLPASDWISITDFNQAFALADGDYTLRTRLVDIAGNVGLAGPDVVLRLDTQAARVLDLAIQSSAATTTALQQDGYLSQTELPGSLEFVLTLSEKVKGLSTNHLQVLVSGETLSPPTLGAVTAWNPDANGYASQWKISVNGLTNLTHGQTLQLRVVNGLGVWDQAHNSSDELEFDAGPLAVDLQATLHVTAVTTLSPTAPRSLTGQTVTINGSALTDGVRISGTSTGIEAGQPVTAILWDDNGQAPVPVKTFSAVAVQADGSWTIDLTQADLTGALVDQVDYRFEMTSRDVAGNPSLAVFKVLSRLTASIDILNVVANNRVANGLDGTVLQFDDSANRDTYINRVDKNLGSLTTGDVFRTGFTVKGISDIGTGRTVSVQLVKDGLSYGYGSGGVVDQHGKWSVYFSRGMVSNLTEGTWQLLAQGTDADGNAATLTPRSHPSFTVDTQASLVLNPVGDGQQHVNLTHNGNLLTVSGSFNHIDPGNSLRLSLIDRNANNSEIWSTQQDIAYPDLNPDNQGNWHYNLDLQVFDGLTFAHEAAPEQAEVARLSLVASTVDVAGNKATAIALFEMDRTPPVAPDVGPAVRQIAGETLPNGVTTGLQSKVTLQDSTQGVFMAPNASAPQASDIDSIIVDVIQADTSNDQWRLGSHLWSMTTNVSDTVVTLGTGSSAIDLISGYDATTQRLVMQARSGIFTPNQVQAVLSNLAWVNTSSDSALDQSSREFTVSYKDAFGNMSASTAIIFSVDTHPPTQPSGVTIVPTGGVITTNTLNGTNTSMSFEATIAAGEASGGRADFFLANQLMGSDTDIENHDSSVSFSLGTSSNAELRGLIPQGGELVVVLYDAAGNVVSSSSASNPVLVRDVTRPVITKIFSSTADGPYRAGQAIALSVETDEDIADPHSTLVLTLATGTAAALGLPGIPDRSVTLTRDTHNPRRFNGTYTVQADDTSADLNVTRADWDTANGAIDPRDSAGNALDLSIAALVTGNTLAGSSDIVIDTTAPTTLNSLTVTTAVAGSAADGTVVSNTLNSTNTALKFSASIGAGEATGGYAEFFVGNTLVGTSSIIGALDSTVTYTTESNGVITNTPSKVQLKITQGGPVVAKLYDAAGNVISANGPTLVRDVAAEAPVVSVSSAALVNGTAFVTSSGFTLEGGVNGVESGATVTVKAGNTVLGSVIASLVDGSWSLPIQSQLLVAGLTTMDGITPSTANGTYSLLSAAEVAALGSFSQDFAPANITPVLDLTKPVYRTTTAAGVQWYLWARVDGGYILSQQNSSTLWYWEQYLSTPALLPEMVTQSSSWNVSTGSLAAIQAEMAVSNGLSSKKRTQAVAALTNLNAVTSNDLVYTVQQADQAGNVSTSTAVRVRVDTVAPAGLDLSDALAGTQLTLGKQTTSTAEVSGVAWLDTVRAPLNTDIQTIQVVLSGAGLKPNADTVAFSTTAGATPPAALSLNTNSSVAGASIGGVSVIYDYIAPTQTLRLSRHDGQAFTGDEVRAVLHALQLKNADPNAVASAGDRVASFTLIDQAGWSSAVATATLGVFNDTLSLDLDSNTTGTQSTLTRYLRVTSDLNSAAGASLVSSAQAPTSNSISELKLTISGAGLDLLNDQLVLSSSLSLSLNTQVSSNAGNTTVGGVSNLNYSYTPPGVLPATSGTLSLSKQGLTGSDVKNIIDAITLKNLTATPKQGERLIQYAVVAGQESGAVSSVSLTLDTLVPVLDLNAALAGVQTSVTKRANASKLAVGESFLAGIQTPSADDIRTVQVVLSGLTPDDIAQGTLVVGSELSLGSSATTGSDQTIASVSGMRYSYNSGSKTLELNKGNGLALSGSEVKSLLEGIKLKNTSSPLAEGGRVATVTLVDMAGNSSSSVSATLNVDTTAPTTLSATLDNNSLKFYGMLSLGDIMGSSNPHNLAKGETSGAIALPSGFTSTTLLSSLRGMNMEWGGSAITGNANTTQDSYYSFYSFTTAPLSGAFFKVSHQSGSYTKGAEIRFTDSNGTLTLSSASNNFYYNNIAAGSSGANDVYSPVTLTSTGSYDIGNVRLLYQISSTNSDLTPTINVTYDATRAAVGDRIDLYEGAVLLGSRTLTAADTASGAPVNKTLGVEVLNNLGSGSHSIQARYTDTAGTTVVASDVTVTIAANLTAPSLSDFKVNGQVVNSSTTAYAMVSDSTNVTGLGGGGNHALTFTGTLAQQSLVSISMGGKIIGFGDFAAGSFTLKAAANILAPGFYQDLTVTVTDTSSGASKGQTTVVQNQTLGWYWAAAVLGNTNGGNGDDTLILGPTGSSGTGATIQTGLGNDIVQVGGYGATANLTATISDFLLGTDRVAINGQSPSSLVANSANNYYTKYIASGTGGINSNTGTKLVIDLDGGGAGTATYTLSLPGVVYDASNFNNTTLKTIFGI